jgi:hypothetical protein
MKKNVMFMMTTVLFWAELAHSQQLKLAIDLNRLNTQEVLSGLDIGVYQPSDRKIADTFFAACIMGLRDSLYVIGGRDRTKENEFYYTDYYDGVPGDDDLYIDIKSGVEAIQSGSSSRIKESLRECVEFLILARMK